MTYNMFGWDTVYAISANEVNKALAANPDKTLQDLDYQNGPIKMTGKFGPPSIVSGGSGKLLRLQFPITSGEFVSPGQPNASLANVTLVADLELAMLPGQLDKKNLVFDIKSVAKGGQTGPGLVTPINLLDPDNHLNTAQHAEVFGLLPAYLVKHAASLSYVFAQVNFAKPANNSWLAPVEADYAFMAKNSGENYLGILAVTTQKNISGLQRSIDNGIVGGTNDAGLFISKELFLKNVILPILPSAYPGTSDSTFTYDSSTQSIKNTGPFNTPSTKHGAITYYPQITSLNTTLSGGDLVTSINGNCSLKAGISMTFSVGSTNVSQFDVATQTISFLPDPHPSSSHSVDVPWYWIAGGVIADAIANIVATVIGNEIADTLKNRAKVTMSNATPQSVEWTDTTKINVKTAGLDNLLYMQGVVANQ